MDAYRQTKKSHVVKFISLSDCGSVGCGLGWAPFVKGLEPIEERDYHPRTSGDDVFGGHLNFEAYSTRLFKLTDAEWDFLFTNEWSEFDDTVEGAVDRIKYLIKYDMDSLSGYTEAFDKYQATELDVMIYSRHYGND